MERTQHRDWEPPSAVTSLLSPSPGNLSIPDFLPNITQIPRIKQSNRNRQLCHTLKTDSLGSRRLVVSLSPPLSCTFPDPLSPCSLSILSFPEQLTIAGEIFSSTSKKRGRRNSHPPMRELL